MELPPIKDYWGDIVRAAKILAPQKLAKDCLSDVGFPPFLTKHKAMLVRFIFVADGREVMVVDAVLMLCCQYPTDGFFKA